MGLTKKQQKKFKDHYFADFETTSKENVMIENRTRVFMWRVEDIDGDGMEGTTIETFLNYLKILAKKTTAYVWFHNLKFDMSFIENHFLNNTRIKHKTGTTYNKEIIAKQGDIYYKQRFQTVQITKGIEHFNVRTERTPTYNIEFEATEGEKLYVATPYKIGFTSFGNEYTTVRDDMNNIYGATWYVDDQRKHVKDSLRSKIEFRDSAKIFPMSLERLGKMFGEKKLTETYDYTVFRKEHYQPTETEWKYIRQDTNIVRLAMLSQLSKTNKVRMTRSSYAMARLKEVYNEENTPENWNEIKSENSLNKNTTFFDYSFPPTEPKLYDLLSPAYSGGLVYVNDEYRAKKILNTSSYDVNSMYPASMQQYSFPIGKEESFQGFYYQLSDHLQKEFPLFVQIFKCEFKLKTGGFPMVPKKFSKIGRTIKSSDDLRGTGFLTLAKSDFEHFKKNYDITKGSFISAGGYMWKSVFAPFNNFIEECAIDKITSEEKGDMIGREMAKLTMNGSYGKFAQSPNRASKSSYVDDNKALRFKEEENEPEAKNYLPMAIFITASARDILLKGVYAVGVERVLYIDTDSIHILGHETPVDLPIDKHKLGFWDWEGNYTYGRYLRDKFYEEELIKEDGTTKLIRKGAGVSEEAKENAKMYALNIEYGNNLQGKQIEGGMYLKEISKYAHVPDDMATDEEKRRHEQYLKNTPERERIEKEKYQLELENLVSRLLKTGEINQEQAIESLNR